ncbi:histidine kinase [Bacteroides sp.]|uniref:sensor histidine kinase n=1 Tax=Bacteroides sp. TaxID=29523 RepID=UPI0026330C74|nr:histidine kinase [Bacteroides sp.]
MKHKKYIVLFILTISISLFSFECIYNVVSGRPLYTNIIFQFLINLPLCIVLGFIDFGIINVIYQKMKTRNKAFRIFIDLALTTLTSTSLVAILNILFFSDHIPVTDIMKSVLAVIPWNWIAVLQIEIFFYHLQQADVENRLATIEKEKALYQFEVLKNQINPHFLFNSLNVLASLAYQDPKKTNLFAKKLSTVYRYLLTTHEQPHVSLQEELSFVESYLYLEYIRFEDSLQVEIEDNPAYCHRLVIPASIQMLVENAIKHNISTRKSPLIIRISVSEGGITVSNNLQLRNEVTANRMGLKNLQHQYALYGRHIDVTGNEKMFVVKIPFIQTELIGATPTLS